MADIEGRYPFSTADGKSIPLDIIRPYGILKKSFLSASSTAALTCPTAIEVMTLISDSDCIIQFAAAAAVASALSDGVLKNDAIFVPADILTVISPPLGKKSFAIIGDSENGVAVIQFLQTWKGLSLASQVSRK